MHKYFISLSVLLLTYVSIISVDAATADPYEAYIKNSKDFTPVKQDKDWLYKAWPQWHYMPWLGYHGNMFKPGYTDAGGKFLTENGYNGAMIDHGQVKESLPFMEKHQIRFSSDHVAGKGILHIMDGQKKDPEFLKQVQNAGAVRRVPLNEATFKKLQGIMKPRIEGMMGSDLCSGYALDDEPSWGHFVRPCMWRVNNDDQAYRNWLEEIYGNGKAPAHKGWVSQDNFIHLMKKWSIAEWNTSQLLDQWTYNDSVWCNLLGRLVEYGNSIDPKTPVGFVGGQSPNAFGGFDYAKLMRKIQFLEAYNLGSSQAVIRSFNPQQAMPTVTTIFPKKPADTIWQCWYYLAHGNRGFAGWMGKNWWKNGNEPADWHKEVAKDQLEVADKIGPLLAQGEWIHDGVAIYYSQASIQLGWMMDALPHGKTWRNRNDDHLLGASHHVRHAWQNMLRDEGLQYNFINYVDVVQKGVPDEYKVLILPAVLCLSDAEAKQIEAFVDRGGLLIADYMPGLWDQHGIGRKNGGALDHLFAIKHSASMKAIDVFQTKGWAEANQDSNYSWHKFKGDKKPSYKNLLSNNSDVKREKGFAQAVRNMKTLRSNKVGTKGGRAVLMNLSPQWYNAVRTGEGYVLGSHKQAADTRSVFMKPILEHGLKRWVEITSDAQKAFGYEVSYFEKDGRTILFVTLNVEILGNSLGGGNASGLKTDTIPVTISFDKKYTDIIDERSGKKHGSKKEVQVDWQQNAAVVLSFKGSP
ncbi:MAG: beta-galactosidase trimerization domain-containing protein [Planctomycetes bacterium]|nr:beta-galactosidase trimerization domain-containing protein [Planctomycetota bacterium]